MATAIVTGSGRGIGRETAILLAKKGVNVVVCSRTQSEINNTVEAIKEIHLGVLGVKCDVSVSWQVDNLVKKAVEKFGPVDILVNNAGIFTVKKLVDTSEKEWDQILAVNLKGAFLCCKAVLPYMLDKNSGAIVNISSGAGKVGFDSLSAYCASKFGMMGLTESLSWEVAGHKIKVMAICPGEVATKMQEADPEYYKENRDRMLEPKQVAAKIVDMIFSDKYRNGQSVDI
ncbi:glucose/ribitol dehydrogenase family protein [Candidatus Nitrososphaera gargensis Ga9.2]|uniref:Glucose/ribitol dehydrogenase family protein n=1 Tax=Nitrososphaera gargensis (strain Ga9.2) TaxID=1237085 RepID=K0IMP7_NITGG|nr:SDR family oxidoreductase [Candidatus Nitrososphaera gargensis]AFU58084.1 glucose/ribitol dehydrogenase family protein [Candidatus Nitrososphaera gargensis Ga9.2]